MGVGDAAPTSNSFASLLLSKETSMSLYRSMAARMVIKSAEHNWQMPAFSKYPLALRFWEQYKHELLPAALINSCITTESTATKSRSQGRGAPPPYGYSVRASKRNLCPK